MFMNDPDFDDEFQQRSPGFEYGEAFPSPDSKQRGHDDDRNGPSYGNSGMGTPQNGRARVLAQQREIQLKKRQSNLLSGGMVRSSLESTGAPSPFRQSTDNQFTPALRQFSAPKNTAKDPSYDASPEKDSEFTKKSRSNNQNNSSVPRYGRNQERGYSDDEDDARAADAHRRAEARRAAERDRDIGGRDSGRDRDRDGGGKFGNGSNSNRRSNEGRSGGRRQFRDDEDDDDLEDDFQRRNGNNYNSSRSRNNNSNRDDQQQQAPSSSTYRNNNSNNYGSNRDDDSFDGGHRGQSQSQSYNNQSNQGGKWAGATGGREVYGSTAPNSAGTDRDRNYGKNEVSVVQHAPQASVVVNGQTPSRSPNPHTNNSSNPQSVPLALVSPNLSDMRAFLCSPLPRNNGVLQCYIRRNKSGTNKLFPIYSLYLKEGDVFLMASKKRPKNKTSNYLISMDQNDLNRTGRGYLGKLRSNFVGTEFQVFDNGVNPKDSEPDEAANSNGAVRCELGSVMYAANVLGSRGPRKMQVALPGLDEHGRIMQWKDNGGATTDHHDNGGNSNADDTILTRMKDRNLRDLNYLINKPPRWNEQVGAYVLNFNGRVTMASVKNFQLVDPDEQNAVVLQFGRVGKDEFTMDLQHPISPFQAFAVTLSSFDSKIACD
uniref:Tubby C-terminal domain-containing protein n=1 Tax=Spumella elongata TaxID=89044 RepID=A0A7S3MBZ0_9STRA|mmetsp:Transcript_45611/g.79758  ORF Transcript_45611/g.79758 Transcript_45611/m.79758 type:complete len:655 (+) Transcript_45611:92-2056(+)